jgi:hypothetical protein
MRFGARKSLVIKEHDNGNSTLNFMHISIQAINNV